MLALAACSHESSQTAASDATPSPVATAVPAPAASAPAPAAVEASHIPAGTPRATVLATAPAAVATPATTVVPSAAPPAVVAPTGPKIYTLTESTGVVHAGQSVSFAASTTPDIDSVSATVAAYTLPFVRTGVGRFSLAFAIPTNVPGVFHGAYSLAVTARAHGGATVSRSISITFQ